MTLFKQLLLERLLWRSHPVRYHQVTRVQHLEAEAVLVHVAAVGDLEAEDVAVVEKQSDVVFFAVIITHVRI